MYREIMDTQRKVIGGIALLLPLILWVIAGLQNSISYTYFTPGRDIFVASICAAGLILITYIGYDRKDDILSSVAGILGVIVALVPCHGPEPFAGILMLPAKVSGIIHITAALSFFTLLAYICGVQFSKTRHLRKRLIFRVCALVMVLAEVCILAVSLFHLPGGIYLFEAIALWGFGVSWLVKGV